MSVQAAMHWPADNLKPLRVLRRYGAKSSDGLNSYRLRVYAGLLNRLGFAPPPGGDAWDWACVKEGMLEADLRDRIGKQPISQHTQ